ncbi:septation ring formation regulator EzrA [Listeria aquatica]|uniref:septation ring formation regulator EzrA n=1 Tax=Listeria aquatica TaxID=1494960 RepID=UPI003F724E5A
MFYYILIGFIVVIIALFGTGYWLKKKHSTRIGELEAKCEHLRDLPVIDELSKVKKLKLTGQTEKLFESWRSSWDEISTKLFPDVEEVLLNAEMNINHYRFGSATQDENDLEQMLVTIENQINQILNGLRELLASEEKNALESRATKEKLAELRRFILTHGFKLGKAQNAFEKELDEIQAEINQYDTLTDQGDHLEAREVILATKIKITSLDEEMERTPKLLHEAENTVPSELVKLEAGYAEMLAEGYYLEQLGIQKEMERLKKQTDKIKEKLSHREIDAAESLIHEVKVETDLLYDTLEGEVHARSFILENKEKIAEKLEKQEQVSEKLSEQIAEVKGTYHISEEELAAYLKTQASLAEQKENFARVSALQKEAAIAYSAMQDTLREIEAELAEIAEKQDAIGEDLRSLRKDELEAREDADEMKRICNQIERNLSRARLPGIPEEFAALQEHFLNSVENMEQSLVERPLNIKSVAKNRQIAKEDLAHLQEKAEDILENAKFVEAVVQYSNRYRMDYPELAESLNKAERHFYGDHNYKKALEIAVTALEKVEPSAFKKIEKAFEQTSEHE